jgi:hypothetical protein
MTNDQAAEYAAAAQVLAPFGVALLPAAHAVADCLKLVADLPNLHAAAKHYAERHKTVTRKTLADAVEELFTVKS